MPALWPILLIITFARTSLSQNASSSIDSMRGQEHVGWVPPDPERSTWDILLGCFTIFLVCSWKCIHLNIPTSQESEAGWNRYRLPCWPKSHGVPYWPKQPLRRKWMRKLIWMGLIAIAPELGVALAVKQHREAKKDLEAAEQAGSGLHAELEWSMVHAFYANMGGLVLQRKSRMIAQSQDPQKPMDVNLIEPAPIKTPPRSKQGPPQKDYTPIKYDFLCLEDITNLQATGFHDFQVDLPEEDIQDRSKADAFTKAFALLQSTWLVIECIGRAASGLAITQLELTTLAFVLCALVTYIVWWHKPFDVERRYTIFISENAKLPTLHGIKDSSRESYPSSPFRYRPRINDLTFNGFLNILTPQHWDSPSIWTSLALYATGIASSALHLAAWNWDFPSPLIRTLWRSFGIGGIGAGLIPLLVLLINSILLYENYLARAATCLGFTIGLILLICYIFSRLGLFVLTFYCFSSMPVSAYAKVDWIGFIPHFS